MMPEFVCVFVYVCVCACEDTYVAQIIIKIGSISFL